MPKFLAPPAAVLMVLALAMRVPALAQGETTSAIVGSVTDPAGAAIPGVTVTVTNVENGLRRSAKTDDSGRFSFPQLKPGTYSVKAEADRFEAQQNNTVSAGLGQKQSVDFKLSIASASQSILVQEQAPLINPENPNTSTTLTARTIENLPNPGGDMTYPLQFAAGALINTAGSGNDFVGGTNGYGNVQFNGLPSLSNGYIVDGLETNDPLTNLNSGLSTNLVLGLNSIAEVTVNTLSYAVDQGRYGASQVNYVTKSGTNRFHGNLYELWNGSKFNAANFFTNATAGNHKPRSTVNHFGGSVGGPILHDKLFFFFDSEWVRIALPIVSATTVPTPAFQNYVLQQLPRGGADSVTGSTYQPAPQLVPFYQKLFSLYGNTAGTPLPVLGCPFNSDGTAAGGNPPYGNGCANRQSISHSSDDREQVQTARIDYNIDPRNMAWFRFQLDTGLQAAYTDSINPLFNAISSQPLYSFASGYTHVFSAHLVNYFNPAFSWYESLFGPADFQKTLAAFPIVLQGSGANAPFTTLGGLDNTWIQGRRATRFFINDNLAWTLGSHELRFGTNSRIFRLNDYDFGAGTVPLVTYATLPQFILRRPSDKVSRSSLSGPPRTMFWERSAQSRDSPGRILPGRPLVSCRHVLPSSVDLKIPPPSPSNAPFSHGPSRDSHSAAYNNPRITRIDHHIARTDVLIAIKHLFKRFAAVERSINAAFFVRPVWMTGYGNKNSVRIFWIDSQLRDLLTRRTIPVLPRCSSVSRFINAVAD